jgi:hypothetical protein
MINYNTDPRIILTLDTGGTNMVFGAMQRGVFAEEGVNGIADMSMEEIDEEIRLARKEQKASSISK